MTKRYASVIGLLLVTAVAALAQPGQNSVPGGQQNGTIIGRVYDADLNVPIEYTNIVLRSQRDSSQVTGTVTDKNGAFRLDGVKPERYFVELSFIGYRTKTVGDITLAAGATRDMGRMTLQQTVVAVQGVEATAERPALTFRIDKKVVDVAHQQTAANGTAVDVLENVPSVKVDPDGTVTLRGSGNFKVLVDGRPSPLDPSEALQQIPASTINNIELITNPSAKYDPEGMSGIMNVILKKQRQLGVNSITNLRGGTDGSYGGDFLLGYRQGIANLFVGADYNLRRFRDNRVSEDQTVQNDTTSFVDASGNRSRSGRPYGVRAGTDLQLGSNDKFSLGGRYGNRSFGSSQTAAYAESTRPGTGVLHYTSIDGSSRSGNFYTLNVDDVHSFGREGHGLAAHVDLFGRGGTELQSTVLTDSAGDTTSASRTNGTGPSTELTLKLDYTLPLRKDDKFEAGYESRFDRSNNGTSRYEYDTTSHSYVYQPLFSHSVDFRDDVHALYGLYSGSLAKLGFELGLRGEYTDRLIRLVDIDSSVTVRELDPFPTVHLSYDLPGERQLMASYARRIERPEGWDLEPFITWRDAFHVQQGNPALEPENIDSWEVGYQMPVGSGQLSADAYYRITHNVIDEVQSVYRQNVLLETSANVGTDYSLGGELNLEFRPLKWWNVSLSGDAYHYRLAAVALGVTRTSFLWSGNLSNEFQLFPDTRLQVNARYSAPEISAQGTEKSSFTTSAAVKQQFFNRRLSLTLQIRDILGTGRHESTSEGTGFYNLSKSIRQAQVVSLGLTWNFNNFKAGRSLPQNENLDNGGDTGP
ncbi:MAG: TonB-dependent receptor [candidate division WOR-3 bacterium]|nr:TonB-dependent receptor [candidate division WOR-3 bacterium]